VRSVAAAAQAAGADPMKAVDAWSNAIQSVPTAPRPAPLPLQPIHGRSRTPLRRPSAPLQFMAPAVQQVQQEPSPPNTPIEELVIEDC
jgi:hypothetical protein